MEFYNDINIRENYLKMFETPKKEKLLKYCSCEVGAMNLSPFCKAVINSFEENETKMQKSFLMSREVMETSSQIQV